MPFDLRSAAPTCLAAVFALTAGTAVAGDCWVATRAKPVTGVGDPITKPAYARLKAVNELAEARLRDDRRLNAIAGVRYQANRNINVPGMEGRAYVATTSVVLHTPKVWKDGCALDQGRADYLAPGSVTLAFNTPDDISLALPSPISSDGVPAFALSPRDAAQFERSGVVAYNGAGVRLYRAGGKRAIVPFRLRDHLEFWEKELKRVSAQGGAEFAEPELAKLRARRASLSPAELDAQAAASSEAFGDSMWGYARIGDPGAMPLYQIAPDLAGPVVDKGAVQVMVAKYSVADAGQIAEADLRAWLEAFDFSPFDTHLAK